MESEAEWPVVVLAGDIDDATYAEVAAALEFVVATRPAGVIVNLSGVTFFGSSGVRALAKVLSAGVALHIEGASEFIVKVLGICGIDQHPLARITDRPG